MAYATVGFAGQAGRWAGQLGQGHGFRVFS